jgi:DNA polymerase III epsilon subunit-like protein
MVKVIIFDTETTGLPKDRDLGPLAEPNNWPDLVSICWYVYEDGVIKTQHYHLIKPNGWYIGLEVSKIHGITHQQALREGDDLKTVLEWFREDLIDVHQLVAHNMLFDRNVMFNAYKWRLNINPIAFWPLMEEFCTATKGRDEIISKSVYVKYPKLDELYKYVCEKDAPPNAHNAIRDVDVLAEIYWKRWK